MQWNKNKVQVCVVISCTMSNVSSTIAFLIFLSLSKTVNGLDTEGQKFLFSFTRNANPDITNQVLSVSVLNANDKSCDFSLTYREDYHKYTQPKTVTKTITATSSIDVSIPSWYGFNYTNMGEQDDLHLTLIGEATCNVTLLAHNYDSVSKQGDSYLVLPTTWASNSYSFSLPPPSDSNNFAQVYIFPTERDVKVHMVEFGETTVDMYINVKFNSSLTPYLALPATSRKLASTFHITSDGPIMIFAAVSCAGAQPSKCDHVAYMPQPQLTNDCYDARYYVDNHFTLTSTAQQFIANIPSQCRIDQTVNADYGSEENQFTVKQNAISNIEKLNTNKTSVVVSTNGGSNLDVVRYFDGSLKTSSGAYIATLPKMTQYHKEKSAFLTRNDNDTVELVCVANSCSSLKLDGEYINTSALLRDMREINGIYYYIYTFAVNKAGFHLLHMDKTADVYSYFVYGNNGKYSYGYEGGLNKPTVVLAPTDMSTTTNRSPTGTTSGVSTTTSIQSTSTPTGTTSTPSNPGGSTSTLIQSTSTPSTPGSTSTPVRSTSTPAGSTSTPSKPGSTSTPVQSTSTPIGTSSTPSTPGPSTPTTPAPTRPHRASTGVPIETTTKSAPSQYKIHTIVILTIAFLL